MQQTFPFQPRGANPSGTAPAAQVSIAVTASQQDLSLVALVGATGPQGECTMRVANVGTDVIAWCYGAGKTGLTLSNGVPMLPNTIETFQLPAGVTTLGIIGAATNSTLRVVVGDGQ